MFSLRSVCSRLRCPLTHAIPLPMCSSDSSTSTGDYVLVSEDDLGMYAGFMPEDLIDVLSCAAYLSQAHSLPFFFSGVCMGPHSRVWSPATVLDPRAPRVSEAHFVRVNGACGHSYAVARGSAPWLHNATRARLWPHTPQQAIDRALEELGVELRGVFVAGFNYMYARGKRGLFFQDRKRFPSACGKNRQSCKSTSARLDAAVAPRSERDSPQVNTPTR